MKKYLFTIILLFVPVLLSAQDDVYHFKKANSTIVKGDKNRMQAYTPTNQTKEKKTIHRNQVYEISDTIPIYESETENQQSLTENDSTLYYNTETTKTAYDYYLEKGFPRDVTKFLGIKIDGTMSNMKWNLIKKGFKESSIRDDILYGEFNGRDVYILIATNKDKVWRLVVADEVRTDVETVRMRFNSLCKQFEKNPKYLAPVEKMFSGQTIPEDEDIKNEILLHSKKYDAYYYQVGDSIENKTFLNSVISNKYTKKQLANPNEEIENDIFQSSIKIRLDAMDNKLVWFRIIEEYGKYYIAMFYENKYNEADGEDL